MVTKRVLIIEDIEFRQNLIKEKLNLKETDCTQYGEKALELLENNEYDLVFLDHDLIGMKSGSYITKTGMTISRETKTIIRHKSQSLLYIQ